MSISVNQITKIYGTQKALDQVSLRIEPGEIVGLLGPNGAGKSTLMKILTCYLPPTSGSASVCGYDTMEQSIDVRKKVGYLPENNPLYLDLYVREFLLFIANLHNSAMKKEDRIKNMQARVDEIIGQTGLTPEQHKKIGALSKGYRQRVGLAQALLHDPEVLILDEPTSGLDPNQIMEIRQLIRVIGEQKTVLLSTHIMQEVEAVCDRAIIIHKGKIVADDLTHNLQTLAAEKATVIVEFSVAVNGNLLKTIPGITGLIALSPTSYRISTAPDKDIRAEVFRFAVEHKLTVISLQKEEMKMEEVFQELTKN
ncbi:MAG: gliding motility-associated ABC transporter ATP-binding subunit GldA [Bacteroidota bacterium]|nr:gliding motility-associated ABC transporter ATP-binding subunit GldA [Bacteroidota bacterium]